MQSCLELNKKLSELIWWLLGGCDVCVCITQTNTTTIPHLNQLRNFFLLLVVRTAPNNIQPRSVTCCLSPSLQGFTPVNPCSLSLSVIHHHLYSVHHSFNQAFLLDNNNQKQFVCQSVSHRPSHLSSSVQ